MADTTTPITAGEKEAGMNTSAQYAPEAGWTATGPDALNTNDLGPIGANGRPAGWMYKDRKIGPIYIPWYASPRIQLGMVAFVCFLCPGMFNALGGLGGGGKSDATLADNMVRISRKIFQVRALLT